MTEQEKETKQPTIAERLVEAEGLKEDALDIDPKVLESVNLTLPAEFETEIMAVDMLAYLQQYQQAKLAYKTARNLNQHQKAEQLSQQITFTRLAVALIQSQYPGAKVIADQIALTNVKRAENARKQVLKPEQDK